LYNNTTGSGNVAIGYSNFGSALANNQIGNNNTGIGPGALYNNTTACYGVALGSLALNKNTVGNCNIAIGYGARFSSVNGTDNIAMGVQSSYTSTGGSYNITIGGQTNYRNKIGNCNVIIGYQAGSFTSGSSNIFIGHCAGFAETGSSHLYIDNSATVTPLIFGDFAVSRLKINGTLEVCNPVVSGACNYLYLGDKDTDGSWRFAVSGASMIIQRRVTGAYVTKQTIT